ncbi:hypothetical protein LJC36_01090 [Desulfovibrio sp. OttesenSCG-928-C14]|nr:hypothetical protein [Desulfovibrio sp. OttesenSCG-928-C14]
MLWRRDSDARKRQFCRKAKLHAQAQRGRPQGEGQEGPSEQRSVPLARPASGLAYVRKIKGLFVFFLLQICISTGKHTLFES